MALFRILLPLFAILLTLSPPALAQDEEADTEQAAEAPAPQQEEAAAEEERPAPKMYMTAEELDEMEAMSDVERRQFVEKRRQSHMYLSDAQRQKILEERQAAFEALSPEEQESIHARQTALIESFYNRRQADPEKEQERMEKRFERFMNKLTPAQKAAFQKKSKPK